MSYEVWCRSCGCLMKERDGKYGPFFGCTGYPKCKSTRSMKDVETEFDPSNEDLDEYRWDRND